MYYMHEFQVDRVTIKVEVLQRLRGGYRLKVSFLELGIYSVGWRVMVSRKNGEWWVQAPGSYTKTGQIVNVLEFDKRDGQLWRVIEAACIEAANDAEARKVQPIAEIPQEEEL